MIAEIELARLAELLKGSLAFDDLSKRIYATDASIYREIPIAIAHPQDEEDLVVLTQFANNQKIPLIPRASGTSLAGQCVGKGIIVDISKYFTQILEINPEEKTVRVQPGVIRDELNRALYSSNLFFGPNTSTANRATIGGMVGNNSCGSTSIQYGTTRDHVVELKAILSDGSRVWFKPLTAAEFQEKCEQHDLEGTIYRHLFERLSNPIQRQEIKAHFPKSSIHRRNTGYAVDLLLDHFPFAQEGSPFNFCTLLCGSEGTLAFITEIKLALDPLPGKENVVVAAHFNSVHEALQATLVAMSHHPSACELMDKIILDCTKQNKKQEKNRFFLEGDPEAVLVVEFTADDRTEAARLAEGLAADFRQRELGYAFPLIPSPESARIWELRKAGLGLLSNIPGDAKPVACIEDTAVALEDLPNYIAEFEGLMERFGQQAVYYAHAGAGELHLRPVLNLKKKQGQELLVRISEASADLVKAYQGSLSGEHGDGRVRAPFISKMIGEQNYQLLREIKQVWDPNGIFNPGKIVDAPPMDQALRYQVDHPNPVYKTKLDFSAEGGLLQLAEKCNGSGDCRKLPSAGGTMCPSYHATRNEKDTTRARANALREYLTPNGKPVRFDQPELKEVLDLCLSCKGCSSECPSNVDMAALKAEWQYQYYQHKRPGIRTRAFAHIAQINALAALFPGLSNFFLRKEPFSSLNKRLLGVAHTRTLPSFAKVEFFRWWKKRGQHLRPQGNLRGEVVLYMDEFTRYNDVSIGMHTVQLLNRLGYGVSVPKAAFSARPQLSKGFLDAAARLAQQHVDQFSGVIDAGKPLIGIEPSAILGFRDEFPKLLRGAGQEKASNLANHVFLIEEFLWKEAQAGRIGPEDFSKENRHLLLHGHCHQKALSDFEAAIQVMSLPTNYHVEVIPSGCCGMAGSFGYEKEHFDLSMEIGELVLFPAVRQAKSEHWIVASGTSCRHQILDGTGRQAVHPVEVL